MFPIGYFVIYVLWPFSSSFQSIDDVSNTGITWTVMALDFRTWSGVTRLGTVNCESFGLVRVWINEVRISEGLLY